MRNTTECYTHRARPGGSIMGLVRAEMMSAKMSLVRRGESPTPEAVDRRYAEMFPTLTVLSESSSPIQAQERLSIGEPLLSSSSVLEEGVTFDIPKEQ